jgi:MinD superfamily P-loop ATPase
MIVSIASGKGGTGKTTVAVNLALFLEEIHTGKIFFLDCDVEEPNAHIFLKPEIREKRSIGIPIPEVNFEKCNFCGKCGEVCAYNAIVVVKNNVVIFPELCHGCGGCSLLCPQNAIVEKEREIGIAESGMVGRIEFSHGKLNVGEPMAGPLIREVKEVTRNVGKDSLVIIDVPPGTSCPVVEALNGSDFTILVTEPTPFGLNDLVLAVETLKKLKIPCGVVVNRSDIGDGRVHEFCKEEKIPVIGEIPYERDIAVLYSYGLPLLKEGNRYREVFRGIWSNLSSYKRGEE